MCEYYLYNYVMIEDTKWNPLIYVGDFQVRDLASYFKNEQLQGELMEKYEEQEKTVAVQLRKEAMDPNRVITQWLKILSHWGPRKIIVGLRLRDYKRIHQLAVTILQNYLKYVENRWKSLTPELQKKEPHSFHNFVSMRDCTSISRFQG